MKDSNAIRLYEALGCKRLGVIEHHDNDDQTGAAAVYIAPGAPFTA